MRGLPLPLLVGVREEVDGNRPGICEILRPGDRLRERADVRDDGQLPAVKQSLQPRKIGMEAVGDIACFRNDGKQRGLGQRQIGADCRVVRIPGRVIRNKQIVAVVAAEQKYTDQRLIATRRRGGHRVNHVQASEGSRHGERRGGAAAHPDEISSRHSLFSRHAHTPAAKAENQNQ